ncbi:MAG: 3D domain-containing protein [Candidatus Wildermuthbacteria bacterium]|nr:3D domain-containing protein [Candidatus Wildermuthbacteria bacterium]
MANTIPVVLTAYSSTIAQTDDTPFITASGAFVREGIVAANFLPMGTKIKIPDLYGDKVFVVEDRMHPRKKYQVDIWFPDYWDALNFGAQYSTIEVLGS